MTKECFYHINKKGLVDVCRAQSPERCPLGGFHSTDKLQAERYADLHNDKILKKQELIQELRKMETKDMKMLVALRRINRELGLDMYDGLYTCEEKKAIEEKRNRERQEWEEQDKLAKQRADDFHNMEYIALPEQIKLNHIGKYNKQAIFGKAFRGESVEQIGKHGNGGAAMFGRGLYSTTNKAYAKNFGTVRSVGWDELPAIPLALKTEGSFQLLTQYIQKQYNIDGRYFFTDDFGPRELIQRMGYDGLSIGSGKDRIIVKF